MCTWSIYFYNKYDEQCGSIPTINNNYDSNIKYMILQFLLLNFNLEQKRGF